MPNRRSSDPWEQRGKAEKPSTKVVGRGEQAKIYVATPVPEKGVMALEDGTRVDSRFQPIPTKVRRRGPNGEIVTTVEDGRVCGFCKNLRVISDHFGSNASEPDGLSRYCRECLAAKRREFRRRRREKETYKEKKYQHRNLESLEEWKARDPEAFAQAVANGYENSKARKRKKYAKVNLKRSIVLNRQVARINYKINAFLMDYEGARRQLAELKLSLGLMRWEDLDGRARVLLRVARDDEPMSIDDL